MLTNLRAYGSMRLTAVALAFVACVVWAGVALFLPHTSGPTAAPAVSPGQLTLAQSWLSGLPSTADAQVDSHDTACGQPQVYCLVSRRDTPAQLMPEALAALIRSGATATGSCAHPTVWPQCRGIASWHGVPLLITSNAVPSVLDPDPGTTLMVQVDQPSTLAAPAAALPAWSAADPLPAQWRLKATCTHRPIEGAGCRTWSAAEASGDRLPRTTGEAVKAARAALVAHGYATTQQRVAAHGKAAAYTMVGLHKFRGLGGTEEVVGWLVLRQTGPASVTVSFTLEASLGVGP